MESEKSQDLQSASWRPRKAEGISSRWKAGRLETQEKLMFQSESKGWKRPMFQLNQAGRVPSYLREGQEFCRIQAFN